MKNLILILLLSTIGIIAMSFNAGIITSTPNNDANNYEVPEDVQIIIDNSCYMCHNGESRNTKAKLKLDFDKLPDLKTSKMVGKMVKISKVISNGKMPKKSFIEENPDKALSQEQEDRLVNWANDIANKNGGE